MGATAPAIIRRCTKRPLERSKGQRERLLRPGQRAEDSDKIPSEIGPVGNPQEELDSCPGKRTGTCRTKIWDGIISNERIVKSEAFGSFSSFSMMEVMSSGMRTTCSPLMRKVSTMWRTTCCACFRIMLAVPLLQGVVYEEELCKVGLTCHFALDTIFPCQG